jgi:hypothetical protein
VPESPLIYVRATRPRRSKRTRLATGWLGD